MAMLRGVQPGEHENNMSTGEMRQRIRQLEKKSAQNYMVGVVPPIPLSSYVETIGEDGVIFRHIFPADGVITSACLYAESMPKSGVDVTISLDSQEKGQTLTTKATKSLVIKPDLEVSTAQRLTVSVNDPTGISGVWIGLLYQVKMDKTYRDRQLLSAFLEAQDEGV